uniref:CHC2 zinc finger protein n=1 Tax=Pseudomonas phage HRDY3 TaxID=3236930 RepID=A0AB39CE80_9VIRU
MKLDDAFTVIMGELEKIQGPTRHKAGSFEIVCPFHEDSNPSLGINISQEAKVPVGTFNCWSCGASGSWNKLAAKLDLQQIKSWQHFEGTTAGQRARFNRKKKERENTNNRSLNRLREELGGAMIPWPKEKEWRGYPGTMIERVQGQMFSEDNREDVMLALPIYINGRYRGGVKALMEKAETGMSYINTKGDWVMDYGLLGYDFIRKHELFGCKAVVLCEGPRDWLRLVLNKIPACAVLGAKMFGPRKLMLLQGLGITKIYTLTDNDKAGRAMARLIEGFCEGQIEFEELRLPRKFDKDGELIKLDPDAASQKIIDKVKALVYAYDPDPKPKKKKPKAIEKTSKEFPKLSIEKKVKRIKKQ